MMTTRREFINRLATGLLGGAAALGLVGVGKLFTGDIACDITQVDEATKFLTYKQDLSRMGKSVAGLPEKSGAFQWFLQCCEYVRTQGYDAREMYGRVFGPTTGGVDIVDTLWLRFPDGEVREFNSSWSIETRNRDASRRGTIRT